MTDPILARMNHGEGQTEHDGHGLNEQCPIIRDPPFAAFEAAILPNRYAEYKTQADIFLRIPSSERQIRSFFSRRRAPAGREHIAETAIIVLEAALRFRS